MMITFATNRAGANRADNPAGVVGSRLFRLRAASRQVHDRWLEPSCAAFWRASRRLRRKSFALTLQARAHAHGSERGTRRVAAQFPQGPTVSADYLKLNRREKVPLLFSTGKQLTKNTAIQGLYSAGHRDSR